MSPINTYKQVESTGREVAMAKLRRAIEESAPYFKGSSIQFTDGRVIARIGNEVLDLRKNGYELEADLDAVARLSQRRVQG